MSPDERADVVARVLKTIEENCTAGEYFIVERLRESSFFQYPTLHAVAEALRSAGKTESDKVADLLAQTAIPMRITCPGTVLDHKDGSLKICGVLHIDEGVFATKLHHTHSCQACGHTWRPAVAYTVGVRFLPGFRNQDHP